MPIEITRGMLLLEDIHVDKDDVADSKAIDVRGFAGGSVYVRTGALTIMTYHSAVKEGGTYTPMHDRNGNAITQIVSGGGTMVSKSYSLPDEIFGRAFIKIVATTADATVDITLKA